MSFLTDAEWQEYRDVINEFHEDANQETVTWRKHINVLDRYGEDKDGGPSYNDTPLLALVQDNFFRSWPINDATVTGKIDQESVMLYINTQYLVDTGYANAAGQLVFDPGKDFFIVKGVTYKVYGELTSAQAKETNLFNLIILRREEIATSAKKYSA